MAVQVTNTQKVASDVQIEKMEKELAKMRANLSESVQLIEQREMNTNIEYVILPSKSPPKRKDKQHIIFIDFQWLLTINIIRYEQLSVRANALREELHTEIERILNDVIKFKVHIQKNLEDFEGFVVDEVEHELGPPSPHPQPHTATTTVANDGEVEDEEDEENGGADPNFSSTAGGTSIGQHVQDD